MPPKKKANFINAIQEAAELPLDQKMLLGLIGYSCRRAYINIMPAFEKRMAKFELRPADFSVLSLLKSNPNITQKRLSQAINVSPPNLATLLDRLENRGLVIRQRNPMDKRSQTLVLTAEGIQLCSKAEKAVVQSEMEATAMLSDAERGQLLKLLHKVFVEE